jgi:hypothetical protein
VTGEAIEHLRSLLGQTSIRCEDRPFPPIMGDARKKYGSFLRGMGLAIASQALQYGPMKQKQQNTSPDS